MRTILILTLMCGVARGATDDPLVKKTARENIEAQTKKQTAETRLRVLKGRLTSAQETLANANAQVKALEQQKMDYDHTHRDRMNIADSVTPFRAAAENARAEIAQLRHDILKAEEELKYATKDASVTERVADDAKDLAPIANPKLQKVFVLKDGTRISVFSVLEDGDDYLVKGEKGGIKRIAKADVVDTIFPDQ